VLIAAKNAVEKTDIVAGGNPAESNIVPALPDVNRDSTSPRFDPGIISSAPSPSAERPGSRHRVRRPNKAAMMQGQLPLTIVSKGRFDKSEPTIHKGEDLDIPTYIRRGVPLN
jgi:cell division protein FtsZ